MTSLIGSVGFPYLVATLVAVVTTLIATPLSGRLAGVIGAMDEPDARKVHNRVIPRLGGIGIYAGFLAGLVTFLLLRPDEYSPLVLAVLVASLVIVITGVLDDIYALSAKYKFVGQSLAAAAIVFLGPRIEFLALPFGDVIFLNPFLSMGITFIWVVSLVNIINFIDGLDGLAAGVASIAALTLFFYAVVTGNGAGAFIPLILAGAAIAFLRYNFNPASIFMGDSGSMLLGLILGAVTVSNVTKGITFVTLLVPLLMVAIPIFDTVFAIIRRGWDGQSITQPDKGHIHHRLLHRGNSQKRTVVQIYLWSFALSAAAIGLTLTSSGLRLLFISLLVVFSLIFIYSLGLFESTLTVFRDMAVPSRSRSGYGEQRRRHGRNTSNDNGDSTTGEGALDEGTKSTDHIQN